jgi:hypothetical protein
LGNRRSLPGGALKPRWHPVQDTQFHLNRAFFDVLPDPSWNLAKIFPSSRMGYTKLNIHLRCKNV